MVPRKIRASSPVNKSREGKVLFLSLLLLFVATLVLVALILMSPRTSAPEVEDGMSEETEVEILEPVEPEAPVKQVDFQPVVDEWVSSNSGTKSVYIYDLDLGEIVGAYNTNENYNTASLYKLFVVYEGYRRVTSGEWDSGATVGSTGRTVLECLDVAIRESNSPCAETLWGWIGHAELDEIIESEFDIHNSSISALLSNASDIGKIMQIFYNHTDMSNLDLVAVMKDSFLNQPVTTYDWRQGLPRGFSEKVNVYNKVGWLHDGTRWKIYHDAAILEFPNENRHFIMVVMTYNMSFMSIRELAQQIENSFYEQIND